MNKSFLILAFLTSMLLWTACKPEPESSATEIEGNSTENTTPMSARQQAAPAAADPVASPVPPPLDQPVANALLDSPYWVAEFWVENQQNSDGVGRWWKFEPDGTYSTGHWQETLAHGVWTITDDQGDILLHLDADKAGLNEEFEIQGRSRGGGYMSWVGTKLYGMNMIAVKSISLLTMPTKQQFGVEE